MKHGIWRRSRGDLHRWAPVGGSPAAFEGILLDVDDLEEATTRTANIGAFLGDGFASPLLLQIAGRTSPASAAYFRHASFSTQAWAFKHDSAWRGLNIHADAAAVNVNFWITPDDANLDPESGGLVVWDKGSPREWDFETYNSDKAGAAFTSGSRRKGEGNQDSPSGQSSRGVQFRSVS